MTETAAPAAPVSLDEQIKAKEAEILNIAGKAEELGKELDALKGQKAAAPAVPANPQENNLVAFLMAENQRLNNLVLTQAAEIARLTAAVPAPTPAPAPATSGPQEVQTKTSGEELHFTEAPLAYAIAWLGGNAGQPVKK